MYLYNTLEIRKYINQIFDLYKIKIHNCKISYSHNFLQLFISFYLTEKTNQIIDKNIMRYQKKGFKKMKRSDFSPKNSKNRSLISKQVTLLKRFESILLESLYGYTKRKINVSVKLQNLNKSKQLSSNQIEDNKIIFKQLKKFARNPFFKEAVNILFIHVSKRKSAKILANFISYQLKLNQIKSYQSVISRKDNYFLGFLKQSIKLLIGAEISKVKGLKLTIKGRFNKAPRARKVTMQFGKFSLQSVSSKIDYAQSTAYTINGTFGVKI